MKSFMDEIGESYCVQEPSKGCTDERGVGIRLMCIKDLVLTSAKALRYLSSSEILISLGLVAKCSSSSVCPVSALCIFHWQVS